ISSVDSPRSFGASRATCSISSLMLTAEWKGFSPKLTGHWNVQQPIGRVFRLKLLAPAFDFRVVENLADDAAQQAFQIRIFHVTQATDRLLLVGFIQLSRPLVGLQLGVKSLDLLGVDAGLGRATPDRFKLRLLVVFGFFIGNGEQQARSKARNVVRLAFTAKVAQVVANLVRDAERFAVI